MMRKILYSLFFVLLIGNLTSCDLEETFDCVLEFILVSIDYNESSTNIKEITFTINYNGDYTVTNVQWDFDDGNSGAGSPATHTYNAPGQYEVSATVTLDNGSVNCTSDVTANITVL